MLLDKYGICCAYLAFILKWTYLIQHFILVYKLRMIKTVPPHLFCRPTKNNWDFIWLYIYTFLVDIFINIFILELSLE